MVTPVNKRKVTFYEAFVHTFIIYGSEILKNLIFVNFSSKEWYYMEQKPEKN